MKNKNETKKYYLDESDMPTKWYNIQADLAKPLEPGLSPITMKPLTPDDLAPLFPMALIMQEVSQERFIDIPEEVLEYYRQFRPTPLIRAYELENLLKTKAKIYYKYEGVSAPGSHKANTALAQAYYNKKEGVERLTTETGAGQWGSALSYACNLFDLQCKVYMVKASFEQKPYRKFMMQMYNGQVVASPSNDTEAGREILKKDPNCPGSLGIAIGEAVEDALKNENTKYSLGSVLNFVLMHQTIIGQEVKKQLELMDEKPDVMIGCVGGGSNFAGFAFPYVGEKLKGKNEIRFVAVEPEACPTLTKGVFAYDFGDTAKLAPVAKMYTLGHDFIPDAIHAGGLRYHGMAPLISKLLDEKVIEAKAYPQTKCFDAALKFARTEGIIPAPESSHAIAAAIDEALRYRNEEKTIVFNLSGHGHFDMSAYDAYLSGKLKDADYSGDKLNACLKNLPKI